MAEPVLDRVGWVYVGVAIGWTVALMSGMLFLQRHRRLPCVRIRRLPVLFAGILPLHAFGLISCLVYVIVPTFPCSAEFWIMSMLLPFGIAMFQAANSQFLHIASRQKQYAHASSLHDDECVQKVPAERQRTSRWRSIFSLVKGAGRVDRLLIHIGLGMVVQLLLTLLVFLGSKKFHPGYGLWDFDVKGTGMQARMDCNRGWEWWLSIVWQFFWAWIYAPFLLWKSRNIRDCHGWRIQTICCCIAGLPASPLWLTGLYAPKLASINANFPPPTWFAISIFCMEVITIGFPMAQVFKHHTLREEILDAIASWEKRQHSHDSSDSTIAATEYSSKHSARTSTTMKSGEARSIGKLSVDSHRSDMLTMAALENALRMNAIPLLHFAALKDFSGENVSFLTHVADWRRAWLAPKTSTAQHRHIQFVAAVRIYARFVSLEFSEFPINIPSREMKDLHDIFEPTAVLLSRSQSFVSSTDSAAPFDNPQHDSDSTTDLTPGVRLGTLGRANLRAVSRMVYLSGEDVLADVAVPDAFSEMIFNSAEREIKYLVLTNTWPKFVNEGFEGREQEVTSQEQQTGRFSRAILC